MRRLERLRPKSPDVDLAAQTADAFETSARKGGSSLADRLIEAAHPALPAEQAAQIERDVGVAERAA